MKYCGVEHFLADLMKPSCTDDKSLSQKYIFLFTENLIELMLTYTNQNQDIIYINNLKKSFALTKKQNKFSKKSEYPRSCGQPKCQSSIAKQKKHLAIEYANKYH